MTDVHRIQYGLQWLLFSLPNNLINLVIFVQIWSVVFLVFFLLFARNGRSKKAHCSLDKSEYYLNKI